MQIQHQIIDDPAQLQDVFMVVIICLLSAPFIQHNAGAE